MNKLPHGRTGTKTAARRAVILLALAFAAILVALFVYPGRYGHTPAFRDAKGQMIPGSIAEMQRPVLGGVAQSVLIRGRNTGAPILVMLHGGPGSDETGMFRHYNAALEDHFIVVYWVQRGTGRSYSADIPVASMRRAQFVADLDQLIESLKARFHQRQVVLLGHSWGSSLGVAYAQAHPGNVAAFVGVGLVVNAAEGERRSYAFTLGEARRRGDAKAIADLTRIGPPPYSFDSILVERGWMERYGGATYRPFPLWQMVLTSFRASEMTVFDGLNFIPGGMFSGNAMAAENARVDWPHTATRFAMPVFIFAGRHDQNTPASLAHEYFERIDAPAKTFIWFEQSAHSPPFEQPRDFNAAIIDTVLPVVLARPGRRRQDN
jgi:pimeloyl-ACP methyl ester carboxylesterase